jgi:hypothetical protein
MGAITMTQYMLSVHVASDRPREPMTEDQQRAGFAKIAGLETDMEAAGALVYSARLTDASEAKVVRKPMSRVRQTDGPFVETKEQLGGFYLVEAPDFDAALDWASRVAEAIDQPIEVRPLAGSRAGRGA